MAEALPTVPLLLSAEELARMLAISKPSVWRLRESGRLPAAIALTSQCIRFRRRTGDPRTGIEDWIEAGCPNLAEPQTLSVSNSAPSAPAEQQSPRLRLG